MRNRSQLSDDAKFFLEEFFKMFSSIRELPLLQQRKEIKKRIIPSRYHPKELEIEDKTIHGKNGLIPIRLYKHKTQSRKLLPILLFFHKGGWVFGSVQESDHFCKKLAIKTHSIVVSVEYSLAPEHKFPVPLEDCFDATEWTYIHAKKIHGDPNKLIVCGESAGANLAASVSLMARDTQKIPIASQILINPVLTNDLNRKYYKKCADQKFITFDNMKFFWDAYLSKESEGENPYASPLKSKDLSSLPPCFLLTSEHDPLKYEGEHYAQALQAAGVTTRFKCYNGAIHAFLDLPFGLSTKKEGMADIVNWVHAMASLD